jgi:predicted secreted hydrolase
MKNRPACVVAALFFTIANMVAAQYRTALPGYHYSFPRDHFNHPEFQTEWCYFTGNVKSPSRRFGFELTFFRQGVDRNTKTPGPWDVSDLYLAHLALSDLDGGKFVHSERTNRSGPGIAGVSAADNRIWNGNWQVVWRGSQMDLQAVDERFALHLTFRSIKPPVIHGENGVSQKADGLGRASHYISLTHLDTTGEIQLLGEPFQVTGTAWMDHEFFTHQLTTEQAGWDWMSIQLQDNTELMLFRIRRKDGSVDPYSAGTFVDAYGHIIHLGRDDFTLQPAGNLWTSPLTHATYPLHWKISIARLDIALDCSTLLPSQELRSSNGPVPSYWEGAVNFVGNRNGSRISGIGYLEMTGYDHPIRALN